MLGHQITNIDFFSLGFAYGARNIGHEQIRDKTGVQVTRTNDDGIGTTNRTDRLRTARRVWRYQPQLFDRREGLGMLLASRIDVRLTTDSRLILQIGTNSGLSQGHGHNIASGIKEFFSVFDGEQEIIIVDVLETLQDQ